MLIAECSESLQLNLADNAFSAVHGAGHNDPDVIVLREGGDEPLGLHVAVVVKRYYLFVLGKYGVSALFAIRHLQTLFRVLGSETGLVGVVTGASAIYQVASNRGFGSDSAGGHRTEQHQRDYDQRGFFQ